MDMMADWIRVILPALITSLIGWLVWVTAAHHKTKSELDSLKLYVAENYAKKEILDRVFKKLDDLSISLSRMEGRLSIDSQSKE